jgi:hypothetical protein
MIQGSIDISISLSNTEQKLLTKLSNYGEMYLFGGAVRDALLTPDQSPFDLDWVYDGEVSLDQILLLPTMERNRYGGYRLSFGRTHWDIWQLQDTMPIKIRKWEPTLENLVRSTFLNCNAVAYNVRTRLLTWHASFLMARDHRILDILNDQAPSPLICVARALKFAVLHRFYVSAKLAEFIRSVSRSSLYMELDQIVQHVFQHPVDVADLLDDLESKRDGMWVIPNRYNHSIRTYAAGHVASRT